TLAVSGKPFRAGGYVGEFLARELADYLNRTGSLIVILTLIFLSIIMSTQFSFGPFVSAVIESVKDTTMRTVDVVHAWREERRREKQRRDVIAKHTKKGAPPPEIANPAAAPKPLTTAAIFDDAEPAEIARSPKGS